MRAIVPIQKGSDGWRHVRVQQETRRNTAKSDRKGKIEEIEMIEESKWNTERKTENGKMKK
jgi:hypothetical protein